MAQDVDQVRKAVDIGCSGALLQKEPSRVHRTIVIADEPKKPLNEPTVNTPNIVWIVVRASDRAVYHACVLDEPLDRDQLDRDRKDIDEGVPQQQAPLSQYSRFGFMATIDCTPGPLGLRPLRSLAPSRSGAGDPGNEPDRSPVVLSTLLRPPLNQAHIGTDCR